MSRSICNSNEYAVLIVSTRPTDSPLYVFPTNTSCNFNPPHPISNFHILAYSPSKVGIDLLYPGYYLSIIVPSISDSILKNIHLDAQNWIKSIYPTSDSFPSVTDELISDRATPRSGRLSQREILSLKNEFNEKLKKSLDPIFTCLFYRLYPYFLYEDEDFLASAIVYPQTILPLALSCLALYMPISVELSMEISLAMNLLYLDNTVIVHEILTLDAPSAIIKSSVLLYKGQIVFGAADEEDLKEILRIYFMNSFFVRTNSFGHFSVSNRVKINKQERVITLAAIKSAVLCIILNPLTDGSVEFDPWFAEKGLRVCKQLDDSGTLEKLEAEFKGKIIEPEVKEVVQRFSKVAEAAALRRSRSAYNSPIGSPKSAQEPLKKYKPTYYPEHDIEVFHYALADYTKRQIIMSQLKCSKEWYINVLRPLYSYYAVLYEHFMNNPDDDYYEISVNFERGLENQKIAGCRLNQSILYLHYIGESENLKQFAYQLSN